MQAIFDGAVLRLSCVIATGPGKLQVPPRPLCPESDQVVQRSGMTRCASCRSRDGVFPLPNLFTGVNLSRAQLRVPLGNHRLGDRYGLYALE